ncbi:zinc knuckle CX2CX4HX4C containing protein [Tanacetum coccineum]
MIVMENNAVVMIVMKNIAVEYFLDLRNFESRIVVGVDDTQVVVDKLDRVSFAFHTVDTGARKKLSFVTKGLFEFFLFFFSSWKTRNDMDSGFSVATVWDCIRPRGAKIDWYNLVWFSHNIPRHSIHLWLVIQRKLKTQDKLRQWDVWHQVQSFTGVPNMPSSLDMIVNLLSPGARKRSARSIIVKLVFAASCYFIWQERNNRLFKNQKKSEDQLIEVIKSTVRLKLLSCKFKKTKNWWLSSDPMARGSVYDFGYVLRVECQARAVLFFPSPSFGLVVAILVL